MSLSKPNKRNALLILATLILVLLPLFVTNASDADPTAMGEILKETSNFQRVLWFIVTTVFGTMVYYAGMLLNAGVTDYVVGFGNQFNNIGIGFAVNNLWVIMRDFFNLLFIFGLVYIGFQMILKSGDIQPKKMLVHIILAALLVNFSLFFVKAIVDLSNIAATQVANAFPIVEEDLAISDSFLNIFGLQGAFDTGGAAGLEAIAAGGGFAYIFFTMIFFIIAAFVFAVGGILLIIRFIALNLYMIMSPVMFLGWVFPALGSYSEMYWKGFLGRAFFAPAYILMLYFAFVVLDSFSALQGQPQYTDLFKDGGTVRDAFATTLPFFFITAGFLVAAVVVAQKMGADGANYAISLGKSGVQKAKRGTTSVIVKGTKGVAKSSYNRTIGYGASTLAGSDRFRNAAANSRVAQYAWQGTKGAAKGYEKRQDEKVKAAKKLAKDLGTVQTRDEDNKRLAHIQEEINNKVETQEYKDNKEAAKTFTEQLSTSIANRDKEMGDRKSDLEKLKTDLDKASDADKPAIEAKIDQLEKEVTAIESKHEGEINRLTEQKNNKEQWLADFDEKRPEAEARAEAGIQFQRQLALRDRAAREAERFNLGKFVLAGGAGGTGAGAGAAYATGATGATAGGMVLVPAAVAATGTKSLSADAKAVEKALTKDYGSDGYVAMKKEKNKKQAKLLKQVQDEALGNEGGSGGSGGGEEGKKQET